MENEYQWINEIIEIQVNVILTKTCFVIINYNIRIHMASEKCHSNLSINIANNQQLAQTSNTKRENFIKSIE